MGIESSTMTVKPESTARTDAREGESEVAAWVAAAVRGDAAAFRALHARFARSVHAVLLSSLPPADADDALQETFVLAWKRLSGLRDASALGAWLHSIARNVARSQARNGHRGRAVSAGDASLAGLESHDAQPRDERDELRLRVMAHLQSLPGAYRETLTMRLVEGMSGPEIAQATGMTDGSVRVNLCRGMSLLRERLEKEGWP